MKITSFIFLFLYLTTQSSAQQVKNFVSSKIMGGSEDEEITSTWKLPNNDYLVFGYTTSDFLEDSTETFFVDEQSANGSCFLYCLSPSGNIKWKKIIGGTEFDQILDIIPKPNEIVCFGVTESVDLDLETNKGGWDCWVLKLDYNGNKLMSKSFGSSAGDGFEAIRSLNDSTYLACIDIGAIDEDFNKPGFVVGRNLIQFDASFNNMKHVRYLGLPEISYGQKSMFNKNGNLFSTLTKTGNGSLVAKMYKPNGDLVYSHIEYADTSNADIYQENASTNFVFIGDTIILPVSKGYFPGGNSFNKGKLEIIKIAPDGRVIKRFNTPEFTSITTEYINLNNDKLFAAGFYLNFKDSNWSLPNDNVKGFILSLDKDLNQDNTFTFDGSKKFFNKSSINFVDFDFNSLEYTFVGSSLLFEPFTDAQPKGKTDLFFAKYKAYPLGVKNAINSNHGISVYPNPFSNYLQLSVSENEVNYVEIIDLLGRVVQTGFSNKIETNNMVNGQYILRLHLKNDRVYQYKIIKE
jgi:hypothetical protein